MTPPHELRKRLSATFAAPVESALKRRVVDEPWDETMERTRRPFHYALVPPAVWKGSKFERSFVTALGSVWENAAVEVGRLARGWAAKGHLYEGDIHTSQLHVIQRILNDLESRDRHPDWDLELQEVLHAASGPVVRQTVIVDVAVGSANSDTASHEFFEIKAPQPNSDQTKVSKEKMLKLCAMERRECAFYALPFNPYGTRAQYNHPFPRRWFDMQQDRVVLIGDEFWDHVGGDGTWNMMLTIAEEVGMSLQERILSEYLLES